MRPLGLHGTYQAIRSANGPAQHIALATVGITYAGIFVGMVPDAILWAWVASSVLVLVATIWLKKIWLKRSLLLDFTLSCMILTFYFMHDPAPAGPIYHVMTSDGMHAASRGNHGMNIVDKASHAMSALMMAGWSLYLSNLVQRQLLETQRFEVAFDGEVLK